ncbi:MAG: biotin attachment protein [Desulfurococcales archaeon]|nr:biotin attachment protein [Desulfurococcales archaeon]
MNSHYVVKIPEELWGTRKEDAVGIVVDVYVNTGDLVKEGDILVDIEVEKAILSIESPITGTVIEVHVKKNDEVIPGSKLVTLEPE